MLWLPLVNIRGLSQYVQTYKHHVNQKFELKLAWTMLANLINLHTRHPLISLTAKTSLLFCHLGLLYVNDAYPLFLFVGWPTMEYLWSAVCTEKLEGSNCFLIYITVESLLHWIVWVSSCLAWLTSLETLFSLDSFNKTDNKLCWLPFQP